MGAPKQYIQEVNVQEIENMLEELGQETAYFWFIRNGPHDYDKFRHCIHHADSADLGGDYRKIDCEQIKFDKDILGRLERVFSSACNQTWGYYKSPLE